MKINVNTEIETGRTVRADNRDLKTLGDYIQLLCEAQLHGEQLSGPTLYRLGHLSDLVDEAREERGGDLDIPIEDIALFKERLPKAFPNGLIVKRVYDVLEGTHSPIK